MAADQLRGGVEDDVGAERQRRLRERRREGVVDDDERAGRTGDADHGGEGRRRPASGSSATRPRRARRRRRLASSAAGVSSGSVSSANRPRAAPSRSCSATPKYGARCATTRAPNASSSRIALLAARPDANATQRAALERAERLLERRPAGVAVTAVHGVAAVVVGRRRHDRRVQRSAAGPRGTPGDDGDRLGVQSPRAPWLPGSPSSAIAAAARHGAARDGSDRGSCLPRRPARARSTARRRQSRGARSAGRARRRRRDEFDRRDESGTSVRMSRGAMTVDRRPISAVAADASASRRR